MNFTKMHGLGNDYVFVSCFDQRVDNPPALARLVSDRHTGIGSDGLILMHPSEGADLRMEMYNADGSRGRMCGNGIRCVAKYAVERGLVARPTNGDPKGTISLRIETDAGIKKVECRLANSLVESVRVDMGEPSLDPSLLPSIIPRKRLVEYPCSVDGQPFSMTCVSMGNPHAVIFVEDLHRIVLHEVGPEIENAPQFPERINAHFVRVDAKDRVTVRTWERGSGATRACGTGACAVCVAGVVTGRTTRAIRATLPGGTLDVEWAADGHVYMTGPAVEVYSGQWRQPAS